MTSGYSVFLSSIYSFNSDKIPLEDHKRWFNNILNDESVKFYVLEYCSDLIGQLRLDFDEEFPVISISLNRNYEKKEYTGISRYNIEIKNNKMIIANEPIKPNSSPTTENIKSVCGSII